jgi:hypothetical protein
MNRKFLKPLGITAAVLAVAGLGFTMTSTQAAATAPGIITLPPIGTNCIKTTNMYHTFNPIRVLATTVGPTAAKVVGQTTTTDGRSGVSMVVTDFLSTGRVEGLGDVTITLDNSRQAQNSSFILNNKTGDNGATQRMNFFINVEVDGARYRSTDQVTLVSTDVRAFPPPAGTVYELVSEVKLADANGRVVYSFPVGQSAQVTK